MADTVIVTNTPNVLVAEQPPQHISTFIAALPVLCLLFFLIQPIRKRDWKGVRLLSSILVVVLGISYWTSTFPQSIYRFTIDRKQGDLHAEEFQEKGHKLLSEWHLRTTDVASVEMKYNRGDGVIVLVGRDGKLSYPLGETPQQNAPTQYIVLNALRQAIQQPEMERR